jgi:RNA-directed DNA polymerase
MNSSREETPAVVSEKAKQAGEIHAKWHWTEPSVWTDNMLKALEYGVKGGKWFSLIDKVWSLDNLRSAYAEVRRNGGAPGIDNQSVERFGRDLDGQLERLHQELKEGRYQPRPARRKWIDKPGSNSKRPLGIPTVRDRVVEAALKHVVDPIFERDFADCSYGFRPGRGTKDALREVDRLLKEGHLIVVEVDIQSFFDRITHDRLMALVERRVSDGRVLELIRMMLARGVMDEDRLQPTLEGTPQGGVISPLLANIYLDGLDHEMQQAGYRMVRYADDLVVLCDSPEQAQGASERLSAWMAAMELTLHPDKTGVVEMTSLGAWFDFLGYRFTRSKRTGKLRCFVSDKSKRKIRSRLRPYLKRCNGRSLEAIIQKVNPVLRGWYQYFKHSGPSSLIAMDEWMRMRLRSVLRKRRGGRGRGHGRDHQRWPIAYFVERGLFTLSLAHAQELQSLRG